MAYLVKRSCRPVDLSAEWDSPCWQPAEVAEVANYLRPEQAFRPLVRAKLLYDDVSLCGLFEVRDQYVVARAQKDQDMVCKDSCVEFFVRPRNWHNYFNFEMNCGGVLLLYDIINIHAGNYREVPQSELDTVTRFHTLPRRITEEITEPVTWRLGFRIPLDLFAAHGELDRRLSGQTWHGNFTKCADLCSHPQTISWAKLPRRNFHMPECFGEIRFE